MQKIQIHTEYIKLDQFLKWVGLVGAGTDAKSIILSGQILVNGLKEDKRGRKIRKGDIVSFGEQQFEVT
jgi:ribosome-associated protein